MTEQNRPAYAKRLEDYRLSSGKTIEEVALDVGISFESYRDLESYDDEILTCLSLEQLTRLGEALSIDLRDFFSGEPTLSSQTMSFVQLATAIKAYVGSHNMALVEFEG